MSILSRLRLLVVLGLAGWIAYVLLGGLIIVNSLPYFAGVDRMPFIGEKGAVGQSVPWRAALLVHVASGMACLVAAAGQFFRPLLRRAPWLHRWMGRAYVSLVLVLVCPSGMILALFAKGGWAGQTGFLVLGALMFHDTLNGQRAIVRRDLHAHIRWMIRSFAMAATAITFRLLHLGFALAGMAYETNYILSLWLSIGLNAAAAEGVIRLVNTAKSKQRTNEPKTHIHENESILPVPSAPASRRPRPVRRRLFIRRHRPFRSGVA